MTIRLPIQPQRLKVGELASRTDKTVRALHLYEEVGLLRPVERSRGGFRLYPAESVGRVRWIDKLQAMGYSLTAIKELSDSLADAGRAHEATAHLRAAYALKLRETQEQIARLQRLESELERSVEYLSGCEHVCDSALPSTECAVCDLQSQRAPSLVAGFREERP